MRLSFFARLTATLALAVLLSTGMTGCASQRPALATDTDQNDPYESFNRAVFSVNMALDDAVLKPVARGYRWTIPEPIRDRFRDIFNYLKTPVILANNLLQGDLGRAEYTFRRFFINTIGGFGIVDLAAAVGMPIESEDFGQTLATYGVSEGPYLMLPLLGPSNPRDLAGFVVDFAFNPFTYAQGSALEIANYTRMGTEIVDGRERSIQFTDELEKQSVDYYATLRSLYRQRRNDLILNGKPNPFQAIPGISSELLDDEPVPAAGNAVRR